MLHFIEQGGFAMYFILIAGALAILAGARRAYVWHLKRDHSPAALALADGTPTQLAFLTFLIGVGGTCTGLYKVLSGDYDPALTRIGVMESLTPVILASAMGVFALAVDLVARTALRRTGAPRV